MARILLIDDDAAVRDAMGFLLRMHGHDVTAAADGAKGIAALEAADTDLVIIDRFMPNMDGVAAIKAIRARRPRLPIIAISGAIVDMPPGDDNLPTGPEFGPFKSLAKPFKPETLLSVIDELLPA